MAESVLNGKRILAVDDEPDILETLAEEIVDACPKCVFEKATTYSKANEMLKFYEYDLVILDIMGVQGFELLDTAVRRHFRVAMLTAHALSPEELKHSHDAGAWAYLPKEKLGEIVPFLEDIFTYDYASGWDRSLEKLDDFFSTRFPSGWTRLAIK
jgi:CheY-like chemotaxis protein